MYEDLGSQRTKIGFGLHFTSRISLHNINTEGYISQFLSTRHSTYHLSPLRVQESNCLGCEGQIVAPISSSMKNVIIMVGFFFFCRSSRESFCHSFWTEPLLDIFTQGMVK